MIGSAVLCFSVLVTVISGSPMALPDQIYPKDTPFENLDCEVAFKGLQPQEKRYAHYMSRAAWEGQLITLFQTSPESPLIFVFLDKVLRSAASIGELETFLKSKFGFTDDDLTGFFVYCGAFLANGGNYRGFGDTKFLPDVPVERMEALLAHTFPGEVDFWTKNCLKPMYNYAKFVRNLGFPPQGVTTYWSSNCDESDAAIVAEYLTEKRMDAYNQRVFKTVENGKTCYEIRLASQQIGSESDVDEERKGIRFRITRGDYSNILGNVVKFLELAEKEAANDVQKSMLKEYIKSFTTGSLDAHKDGSRHWVKDKGPAVETYIGFIENYRDPAGARAEFEGFVAVVNRKASEKLGVLVHKAESIIKSSMPWPREFEKDSYLKPDFTALDVVTFGSSGVPAGINIPNYDEIRQNEGFKNVHLQNAIKAMTNVQKIRFVSESDSDLMKKWREQAFEVQVGLHELLGHGTGKLFRETADGLNFDRNIINPLTGKPVESWYASGQSYDSVFGELSSTYEECRAEAIGIYLSLELPIVEIFGIPTAQEQEDVNYVNWLSMILSGLRGLEVYSVDANKWLQAHGQARYVILRMLLETAPDLVSITETIDPEDQKPDLLVTMNRSELQKSGREAVRNFLMKMQVFKSLADVTAASKMYLAYSEVPPGSDFARWRDIVVARKKPRTIVVQSNTRLNSSTNEVELLTYPNSPQGFVKSWVDRWTDPEATYGSIRDLYDKDATHFPSEKN